MLSPQKAQPTSRRYSRRDAPSPCQARHNDESAHLLDRVAALNGETVAVMARLSNATERSEDRERAVWLVYEIRACVARALELDAATKTSDESSRTGLAILDAVL